MGNVVDINTQELKIAAPIIPYVKQFYSNKIIIENEDNNKAVAKCIFHKENTASLYFYSNGTYKCFGCGEHGDIITLVQKIENVDFQSACIIIANNVGYPLNFVNVNPEWQQYKDNLDDLSRKYWVNLQNNAEALNYICSERRISSEMINNFRLGFNNINNRIVFPILEHKRLNPQCVGMAYRALNNTKPKYINDPNQSGQNGQNPALNGVFIKGNMLYGLAQSFTSISKNNFVFVVEGYFDVISMHQSGFTNTVGIMGTSFTEEQIKALKKVTNNVFLLLDGDSAGINAMNKYIAELVKYDIRPVICLIKDFKDPDEMCKHFDFNNQKIYNYIRNNMNEGFHYLITNELSNYKAIASRERVKAFNTLYNIIEKIPNPSLRYIYMKEVEKELY